MPPRRDVAGQCMGGGGVRNDGGLIFIACLHQSVSWSQHRNAFVLTAKPTFLLTIKVFGYDLVCACFPLLHKSYILAISLLCERSLTTSLISPWYYTLSVQNLFYRKPVSSAYLL